MKRFLLILVSLLTIGSMYACNLYIEDFEISSEKLYKVVQIKAHFDHYVSGFQLELTLPQGMNVTDAQRCDDLYIDYTNEEGFDVTATPMIGENQRNTKYLVLNTEVGYYDGSPYGVVKYAPGDYVMYELYIDVPMGFKGGDIQVKSITACGVDSRPWVKRCNCSAVTTTTHVSVEGVEPDEPEPTDPHDEGYWLIVENNGNENFIHMEKNYTYVRLVNDAGETTVPFRFRINGNDFGAPSPNRPTDMDDLLNNILLQTQHYYTLVGGHQYLVSFQGWPGEEESYVYCHYADGGGYDSVDEFVADRQVASVRYFDINGREMTEPNGLTIVVTTYTDGSMQSVKTIKR